jgi:hypothetical protein
MALAAGFEPPGTHRRPVVACQRKEQCFGIQRLRARACAFAAVDAGLLDRGGRFSGHCDAIPARRSWAGNRIAAASR